LSDSAIDKQLHSDVIYRPGTSKLEAGLLPYDILAILWSAYLLYAVNEHLTQQLGGLVQAIEEHIVYIVGVHDHTGGVHNELNKGFVHILPRIQFVTNTSNSRNFATYLI